MAVIIAVMNHKGGSGKTTTVSALASFYSQKGNKVLAMDLDPRASLTHSLVDNSNTLFKVGVCGAVLEGRQLPVISIRENLSIAPADMSIRVLDQLNKRTILEGFTKVIRSISDSFDVIIVDLPSYPSELSYCAVSVADSILVTTKADRISQIALSGTLSTIENSDKVDILLVQHDLREKHTVLTENSLRLDYGDKVMHSFIRRNVSLCECAAAYKTIFEYKADSAGATDYSNAATELFERIVSRFTQTAEN